MNSAKRDFDIILNRAVSELFEDISWLLMQKQEISIGLVGGQTLDPYYTLVAKKLDYLPLKQIKFFLADERVTQRPDELNSVRLRKIFDQHLIRGFDFIPIQSGSFPIATADLMILSSGEDGHIASLFPYKDELKDQSWSYLEVLDSPKPPRHRLSISPLIIQRSKICHLFFLGDAKFRAYTKFMDPLGTELETPAKLVQKFDPNRQRRRVYCSFTV